MALLLEAISVEPTTEQEQVCKLILAAAYQLVDASWQDLICGRLASAMVHRRSVWEAYDYLGAAAVDKEFALTWWRSQQESRSIKVETARRKVRDALERDIPGSGKGLLERRAQDGRSYQAFSHVSPVLSVGVMNPARLADGPDAAMSPMGYYLEGMIRSEAAMLALLLRRILWGGLAGLKESMTRRPNPANCGAAQPFLLCIGEDR